MYCANTRIWMFTVILSIDADVLTLYGTDEGLITKAFALY